ncbi:MAG: ABC transporter ATP-binding protein [Cycloclasticus sp.]
MTIAIKVENLSKKYIISHEKKAQDYKTLSESLMQGGQRIANKIIHPFSPSEVDSQTQEEFWALKDINFEINQGDKVGIIGRNGAGKSTLLKVLSRITDPTSGKIHINGRIASLLEVGTGFHPELTGRENIYLNGAILGMSRKEIKLKFDEIVAFAEVEKFLDTPVKRYSSGMYVRLAFAVAAHLESEILVIDEVLAVGDAEFQKKCLGKMDEVSKGGRTILFVSHNLPTVKSLCNKGVYLEQGTVGETGEILNVINLYQEVSGATYARGKIVKAFNCLSGDISISNAMVNNGEEAIVNIVSGQNKVEVSLSGEMGFPRELSLECRLYSSEDICIGLFTTRYYNTSYKTIDAGFFSLSERFNLPDLNAGVFFLDIYLMDMRTNIALAQLDFKITLICEGTKMKNGWTFKNLQHNGFIVMSDS